MFPLFPFPNRGVCSTKPYANFDDGANPGTTAVLSNLTKSLGGGNAGFAGAESRPRGVSSLVESLDAELTSGRTTPRGYRRTACKSLVAGIGAHAGPDGFRQYESNADVLKARAKESEATLEAVIAKGFKSMGDPARVNKSFSGSFAGAINGLNRFSPQNLAMSAMAQNWSKQISKAIGKSFSLASPLSSGFVPFDLMPFVRTIYPVYTPSQYARATA
ncbi:MAG: hypothetical protein V4472_25230 [Pseudomonadota bacterium]